MKLSQFDYDLPQELIAQQPAQRREDSRLMVVNRTSGDIQHAIFHDLIEILNPGDLLVMNDTRVFPARLYGVKKPGGANIEVLLLEEIEEHRWKVLARRAKRLKEGTYIEFSKDFYAVVEEILDEGTFIFKFRHSASWLEVLEEHGQIPLPPYIVRNNRKEDAQQQDRIRYQTVYATRTGSAAAPTAGLHFSKSLLEQLHQQQIETAFITLHIGLDTFQPVKTENVEEHPIHAEWINVPESTIEAVNRAKDEGQRVIAVGTTSVRALESSANVDGRLESAHGETRLFILPGYRFKVVDTMLTNLHLPKSTLIMLVSAFMGNDLREKAYRTAVEKKYRFYSYGDAMLIV